MKLPKPGTMFVLNDSTSLTKDEIGHVADHHGWLFKYRFYDINPDMVRLTSIATGDTVYVSWNSFRVWFKELANAHEGS